MLSSLSSTFLRGLFRVYFVLAFIILGIVGGQCCRCAVKLGLLHGRSIKLNKMTGWISGPSLIKAIWQLRRLPGGAILGMIMIIASILTLVADLATSTLVYQKNVLDRCKFDYGLVVDPSITSWDIPPPFGAAAVVVSNAQLISAANGGYTGIYKKANFALDFYAEETDLLGWWICKEEVGEDKSYPSGITDLEIADDLLASGLQYKTGWMNSDNSGEGTAHLIIWSSSVEDAAMAPFDVKVSIDQGYTYGQEKVMKSYSCNVDQNSYQLDTINTILSSLQANSTLWKWIDVLPGSIYSGLGSLPNTENATSLLAASLNSMTMVQGGFGSIITEVGPGGDPTYGCIVPKTYISIVVLILAAIVGSALVGMFSYWILMLIRLGAHSLPFSSKRSKRSAISPLPDGLVSWMLQATRESNFGQQQTEYGRINMDIVPGEEKQTREWNYEVVDGVSDTQLARLVRVGGSPGPMVQQVASPGYNSYAEPGVQWDPKHGGQYSVGVPLVSNTERGYSP